MIRYLFIPIVVFASAIALSQTSPTQITKDDQKHFQNDSNMGRSHYERIDENVKEVNKLWSEVASLKSEIANLKEEIKKLKAANQAK